MPQVGGPGRASKPPSRSQQLAAKAIKKRVRPVLGLRYYYRSAELLLQQADSYRRQKNEDELYVMLLRYASLVLETIPDHSDFRNGVDSKYQELKAKASPVIEELERLKLSLDTKGPNLHLLPKPPPAAKQDVQQVASTMLPEADWTLLRPPISALPLGNGRAKSASPVAPAPAPEKQPPSAPAELPPAPNDDPGFVLARPSAAALERHCLVGPIGGESGRGQHSPWQHQQEPPQPTERAPLYNIHLMESSPVSIQQDAVSQPSAPEDPALRELVSMKLQPPPEQANGLVASPARDPQLGPQMVEVVDMAPPASAPGPEPLSTCSDCAPLQNGTAAVVPGGQKPAEKVGLKDVHVSVELMEEFMRFASSNTRKGIETCGILAGNLNPETSVFTITTLIVPHQEGTRDTVTALNEEDIFTVQDERGLFPLGWIHTHPTQTCFLSSVDIHTQVGYQTLLDEAVAIVMAPTDRSKRCGIFRLTTPGGVQLIQRCPKRGFHPHPETHTGQPIYELCGHVYLNPRIKMDTVDLRQ